MAAAEIDEADVAAVVEVLRSGRLALGPKAAEFERNMAEYVGVRHAISVASGTAALHMLIRAMGIGPGDEVIVPSFTFAASANAILYERARPVFVDIEDETYNLDPDEVRRSITPRTKAILPVDVFGHPAAWDEIEAIAREHNLRIIDDSCEALGAEYRGRRIGSFGDAATFAFYPNKQITTGEGGMIVTNDDSLAEICRSLRNQGRGAMGAWLDHERLGYNYRLDEMSAALGASQLARIESFLAKRAAVAEAYSRRLRDVPEVRVPTVQPHVRMSWFVYVVTLTQGLDRDVIIREMEAQGVPARGYFSPIHSQAYLREAIGEVPDLPVTNNVARRTLALPFHNRLSEGEIDVVVEAMGSAIRKSGGRA